MYGGEGGIRAALRATRPTAVGSAFGGRLEPPFGVRTPRSSQLVFQWRRGGDSNPRYVLRTHAFQACSLSHSDTSPGAANGTSGRWVPRLSTIVSLRKGLHFRPWPRRKRPTGPIGPTSCSSPGTPASTSSTPG